MESVNIRLSGQAWMVSNTKGVLFFAYSAASLVDRINANNMKVENKDALNNYYSSKLKY
jgi:hypothetical protein